MTLTELQDLATRQQQQISAQQHLLASKVAHTHTRYRTPGTRAGPGLLSA